MILDGKSLSQKIAEELKEKLKQKGIKPVLAIVQVGSLEESNAYIRHKKNYGEKIGVEVRHITLPIDIEEGELVAKIQDLNNDKSINGIIVQLPIPQNLDKHRIIESIDPKKDVDGLHSVNAGKVFADDPSGITPATPKGVMTLLKHYNVEIEGKRALVIGKSMLVGKPVAMLLLKEGATLTIAHSKTQNLEEVVKQNDIVVVAVGKAGLINKNCVREGQVIIDVGTNSIYGDKTLEETPTRKLVGDVDFGEVSGIVSAISPVPGGVGPMTVASLFENLIEVSSKV